MIRFCLGTLVAMFLFVDCAHSADPTYAIAGVNAGTYSNTQMVIEPFSMWMWGGSGDGQMVSFSSTKYPDMTKIGCNGLDKLQPGQSAGGIAPDNAYKLFAFSNPTTQDVCFIVTSGTALS